MPPFAIIVGGILATLAMTAFMLLGSRFGLPRLDAPRALGKLLAPDQRPHPALGLFMDLLIGLGFALIYAALWSIDVGAPTVPSALLFGLVHGVLVLLTLPLMSLAESSETTPAQGPRLWLTIVAAHLVYAVVLALVYRLFP